MLNPELILHKKDDVRYRVVGDEGVVVRQTDAEVIAVNEVGARILELLTDGRSIGHVLDTLTDEYAIDRASLATDVEAFVRAMLEAGVLRAEGEVSS